MKRMKRTICAVLAVLLVLCAASLTAAYAAAYRDGDYTVAFSVEGLGHHNVAWDTATVHVKDGKLTVDFTLERVDPKDHAPRYEWIKTSCGTFAPVLDDTALTCTFTGVEVPNLGRVEVTAQSSAMSELHEIEYVLHIDDTTIPTAGQDSVPVSPETLEYNDNHLPLSGGAIAAISALAAAVIGGAVWLTLRGRKR